MQNLVVVSHTVCATYRRSLQFWGCWAPSHPLGLVCGWPLETCSYFLLK